jgi:hypothetical protein
MAVIAKKENYKAVIDTSGEALEKSIRNWCGILQNLMSEN